MMRLLLGKGMSEGSSGLGWAVRWMRGCWPRLGQPFPTIGGGRPLTAGRSMKPGRTRLCLESLEERQVPSTMPTLTLEDAGGTFNGGSFAATATIAGTDNIPGSSLEGVPLVLDYQQLDGSGNVIADLGSTAPTNAGNYLVVASFAGSTDYDPASTETTFTIWQASPVLTATLPSSGTYNGSAFAASGISIAGVVPGVDDTPGSSLEGVPLVLDYQQLDGSGHVIADLGTTAPVQAGNYEVIVTFAGSTDYTAADAGTSFTIWQANPVLAVGLPSSGPYNGMPFAAWAAIAGVVPGVDDTLGSSLEGVPLVLDYQNVDNGTDLGSTPPSSLGDYQVTVTFAGSVDYTPVSTSSQFTIYQATPTLAATWPLSGTWDDAPFAATATIAGVVSGVDDTPGSSLEGVPLVVDYQDLDNGTDLSGTAPISPGDYQVTATFAGSTDYTSASEGPVTFSISKATPTVALADTDGVYNGSPFQATATVAGVVAGVDDTPGPDLEGTALTLNYQQVDSNGNVIADLGGTAPSTAGNYLVTASFAGSADYAPASSTIGFSIGQAIPSVSVTDLGGPYNGSSFPASATVAGVVPGVDDTPSSSLESVGLSFDYQQVDSNGNVTNDLGTTPPTATGTYEVTASFNGSTDYTSASDSTIFTIAPTTGLKVAPGPNEEGHNLVAMPFNLGSFSDPGASAGPWSVDVNWGDGSTDSTFTKSSPGPLGSQSHTYTNAGTYTVTETVTDENDDDSDEGTFFVTAEDSSITYTWTGQADQYWSNANNWIDLTNNIHGVPTSADNVEFVPGPGGSYNRTSIVDPAFGGSVAQVTVDANYTKYIYLQENLTVTTTFQSGGTIAGSYSYIVPSGGAYDWIGGSLSGFGGGASYLTIIQSDATMTIGFAANHTLSGRTLQNFGTVTWNNPTNNAVLQLINEGGIQNATGGNFTLAQVGGYTIEQADSLEKFTNNGTVTVINGGALTFNGGRVFTTNGTYSVGGALTFATPVTFSGGSLTGAGTVNVNAGLKLVGGTLTILGPTVTTSSVWDLEGDPDHGVLVKGNAVLTVNGATFQGISPVEIASDSRLNINGNFNVNVITLTNNGLVFWNAGNITIGGPGAIENAGTFFMQAPNVVNLQGTGTFLNKTNGIVTLNQGNSTVRVDNTFGNLTFTNLWTLNLVQGTLSLLAGWMQPPAGTTVFSGGALQVQGDFTNNGTILLLSSATITASAVINNFTIDLRAAGPQTLTIARLPGAMVGGDYTQGAAGTLFLAVSAATPGMNDVLAIAGNATFGGSLNISAESGVVPPLILPITYQFITYSALFNPFDKLLVTAPANFKSPNYPTGALTMTWYPIWWVW